MEFLEFDLRDLIPKVYAQGADVLAQPTFGTLEVGDGGSTQASVTLTADSTSVNVGDVFNVDVEIATKTFEINEYRIVIDFDVNKLSVLDAEASTAGTQVEFLDTVFAVGAGDNSVSSSGRITLIARTPSGNALQVNRAVARIRFQSQSIGTTVVEPISGVQGTQLINENAVAIATTLNSLTLSATSSTSTSTTTTAATSTSSATSSAGGGEGGEGLPKTGLAEDVLTLSPFIIGILLVGMGLNLQRERKRSTKAK